MRCSQCQNWLPLQIFCCPWHICCTRLWWMYWSIWSLNLWSTVRSLSTTSYSPVDLNADFTSAKQSNGCTGIPVLLSYFLIMSSLVPGKLGGWVFIEVHGSMSLGVSSECHHCWLATCCFQMSQHLFVKPKLGTWLVPTDQDPWELRCEFTKLKSCQGRSQIQSIFYVQPHYVLWSPCPDWQL